MSGYVKNHSLVAKICSKELLDESEVFNLIRKAQAGCIESRNKVILHNYRLVMSEAHKAAKMNRQEVDDMIQAAFFGLERAISKFDTKKNIRFSTYSLWWIKSFIRKVATRDSFSVHAPVRQRTLATKIRHTAPEDIANIPEYQNLSLGDQQDILNLSHYAVSLLQTAVEGDDPLYTYMEDKSYSFDEVSDRQIARDLIDEAIETLNEKERIVIKLRYLDSTETLESLGKTLKISKEGVRQIETKAKEKLRFLLLEHKDSLLF